MLFTDESALQSTNINQQDTKQMQYITFLHMRTRWWILQVFGAACILVALIASYMMRNGEAKD